MKNKAICTLMIVFCFWACSQKEIPVIEGKFNVTFQSLTINQQFGTNTFLINCSFGIKNGRYARIESQGFCWSTKNPKPTIRDKSVIEAQQPNVTLGCCFNLKTPPLSPDSTYFLNAFVVIDGKTYYSTDNGGKATILKPFNCKVPVLLANTKYLASPSSNFAQEGGSYETHFVEDNSIWFINSKGNIYQYDVTADSWQLFNKTFFNFNPDINKFDSNNNFEVFTIKNRVFTAFGRKNDIIETSNQVFEFMKDTQTWKEQAPIPLNINRNYQTWFATDSSCTFLSYSNTGNGYRPSFWEYKPAKGSFVKLPEIIEFASLGTPKSVQYQDKVIFISKDYLVENFSIYSFDPRINIIKKLTNIDQFCGNYTSIKNLWIKDNTLYFHIERIEPQISTGLAVFGTPLGRFDLQTNQLKPFVDIQKMYEGIKIEYPPYIHFFSDGRQTSALNLSIFLPFQFIIQD